MYKLRSNILIFVFLSFFIFMYILIPFISLLLNRENYIYAAESIRLSSYFLIGFYSITSITLSKKKIRKSNIKNILKYNLLHIYRHRKLAKYLIILGLILKFIGGDLFHSSIISFPWSFTNLYGISDRIYYFGVLLTFFNIYFFGFNRENKIIFFSIILYGFMGGSRVSILIPISFLLMLHISLNNFKTMIKYIFVGIVILLSIVIGVGLYRIDALDRNFDFSYLLDLFLFRISDFYWPTALVEKIVNDTVIPNSSWIFSGLFGIFPSFISDLMFGYSVFGRDTILMLNSGLGSIYMSVPLTPIGEGFYWFGNYFGVILIGAFFGLGFVFSMNIILKFKPIISILILLQMYRQSFTLTAAAFPELVSFCTKDIFISYLLALSIIYFFKNYTNSTKSI